MKAAMEGTRTPALGAVVIRNGKVDAVAVCGVRSISRSEPVQNGDSWFIGSCTKPITASLITRLVDHGVLSWDTPLSAMLPELAQSIRPEYRSVTLLQMLSHRSGMPHDDEAALQAHDFFEDHRPLQQQRLDYIMQALGQPPIVAPGTTAQYSNSGFILAGVIAERATGVPYESLMRREVFGPLGMSSAGFTPRTATGSRWLTCFRARKTASCWPRTQVKTWAVTPR
jgi:CubicO group peptidase (beta-lactamase class C family)